MKNCSTLRLTMTSICATALVFASSAAMAQGHGGGGHFSGGGHAYGGHPGFVGHGGYGGYGYRGGYGYGGYRGYGWRGGYGGWGWGWGLGAVGLGLYFATLPLYYSTLWWDGTPYYYADNVYYRYDGNVGQYQTVAPPPGLASQSTAQPGASTDLIAYPKNGQSAEQQSKDKYECHHWAVGQTGFDPTQGAAAGANRRDDYMRAQAACLDGRGYSVK